MIESSRMSWGHWRERGKNRRLMWLTLLLLPITLTFAQDAPTTIEMTDGTVYVGTLVDATTDQLWLRDVAGMLHILSDADIRTMKGDLSKLPQSENRTSAAVEPDSGSWVVLAGLVGIVGTIIYASAYLYAGFNN